MAFNMNREPSQLAKFDFSLSNREVWMAKVNPSGQIEYEGFTQR